MAAVALGVRRRRVRAGPPARRSEREARREVVGEAAQPQWPAPSRRVAAVTVVNGAAKAVAGAMVEQKEEACEKQGAGALRQQSPLGHYYGQRKKPERGGMADTTVGRQCGDAVERKEGGDRSRCRGTAASQTDSTKHLRQWGRGRCPPCG